MRCTAPRYGNPAQAHYRSLPLADQLLTDVDFFDTFMDLPHLAVSFPDYKVREGFWQLGDKRPLLY